MLILIGAILSILVPWAVYALILRGKKHTKVGRYVTTFLWGATLCTAIILVVEGVMDMICLGHLLSDTTPASVANAFWLSLPRTAIPEELIKLIFAYLVLRKCKDLGPREFILLVGLIGVGYGFTEKLAYVNGGAIILNAIVPGHMLFQWAMGFFLYKALHNTDGKKTKWCILAFVVPMLLHFSWNLALNLGELLTDTGGTMESVGVVIILLLIIVAIASMVFFGRKIRRIED